MKNLKASLVIALGAAVSMFGVVAPSALAQPPVHMLGPDDPLFKDSIGTFTVRCHVHRNAPGNPVVGYVVGNSSKKAKFAQDDADLFVSKFGPNHTKRHCRTQKKYMNRGAYDQSMRPI